jgi:hypothetical protein
MLVLCKLSTTVLNSATLGRLGRRRVRSPFSGQMRAILSSAGLCARCRKGPPCGNIWKFLSTGKLDVKGLPFVIRQGIPSHRT